MAGPALDSKETAPNLWHFHRWTPEGRLRIPGMLLGCPLDEGSCVEVGHPQSAGAEVAQRCACRNAFTPPPQQEFWEPGG